MDSSVGGPLPLAVVANTVQLYVVAGLKPLMLTFPADGYAAGKSAVTSSSG